MIDRIEQAWYMSDYDDFVNGYDKRYEIIRVDEVKNAGMQAKGMVVRWTECPYGRLSIEDGVDFCVGEIKHHTKIPELEAKLIVSRPFDNIVIRRPKDEYGSRIEWMGIKMEAFLVEQAISHLSSCDHSMSFDEAAEASLHDAKEDVEDVLGCVDCEEARKEMTDLLVRIIEKEEAERCPST